MLSWAAELFSQLLCMFHPFSIACLPASEYVSVVSVPAVLIVSVQVQVLAQFSQSDEEGYAASQGASFGVDYVIVYVCCRLVDAAHSVSCWV
jgi:hypothetical protein